MTTLGFRNATRQVVALAFLGVIPVVLLIAFVAHSAFGSVSAGWYRAVDFHPLWLAAHAYASGHNPYPQPVDLVSSGAHQSFVYPAAVAALLTPFSFLPYQAAVVVFMLLLAAAVGGALWMLEVRDWRCYGAAFATPAVLTSISIGTLSPLLLLGIAAAWRWRDRPWVAGLAVGAIIAAKMFLWPLMIWLWFTKRRRAALTGISVNLIAAVGAWAWIGFAGAASYPALVRRLTTIEGPRGYGVAWLAGGVPTFLVATVAGVLLVAVLARRSREPVSFAAAILAALLLTPILWLHYLVLLAAVAAVLRPDLGPAWLLPLAAWATPQQGAYGDSWRVILITAIILSAAFAGRHAATSLSVRGSAAARPAVGRDRAPTAASI
jgi:alpha-1,2-mannosyltransferase